MAMRDTQSERVGSTVTGTVGISERQAPDDPADHEGEFAIFNRLSTLFLLGACLGFAVAVVGFAAGAFYVVLSGSCITLAMTLLWVTSGVPPLVRTIRDWSSARRMAKKRRGSAK